MATELKQVRKMKPCADCGRPIPAVQRKARCKECQNARTKWLQKRYKRTRLGSPKLFKKLKNGRLVPADYNCGINKNGTFPTKVAGWMTWNSDPSAPTDPDLSERERIMEEGKTQEEDWKRVMMYNWKNGIDEHEEPPTKKQLYKKWRYWENI